ncbi:MAG: SAM-dependent chlorinase/fluorinase [Ilumatobacteraceae bacterium]
MSRRYDTVSFLTDWGLVDEFVGVVKSVIRDLAAHVAVTDLTHQIAPFDVRAGSLALARSISYLPQGVVLAVVDPGVGTARNAVAIEVADGDAVLVGPDNGLLAPAVAMAGGAGRAVTLTNRDYQLEAPGATFAGRDIFAPAVAHLCNGVDLYELGEPIDAEALLPGVIPLPRTEDDGAVLAEVLWVDHFGNCQINVGPDELDGWGKRARVEFIVPGSGATSDARTVVIGDASFEAIGSGAIGLVPDSCGMLALVMNRRSAAEELRVAAGDQVVLRQLADSENQRGALAARPPTTPVALRRSADTRPVTPPARPT